MFKNIACEYNAFEETYHTYVDVFDNPFSLNHEVRRITKQSREWVSPNSIWWYVKRVSCWPRWINQTRFGRRANSDKRFRSRVQWSSGMSRGWFPLEILSRGASSHSRYESETTMNVRHCCDRIVTHCTAVPNNNFYNRHPRNNLPLSRSCLCTDSRVDELL